MHDVNFIVCATLLNQQVKSSMAFDEDNAKAVKDDKNVKDVKADTNQLPLPTYKK